MLNMKAMPAAGGAGLADYLWKEAVGVDAVEPELTFEEAVYEEYAKRLARVQAAGVEDIDHDLLWDKASDDVIAAIQRDDAQHAPGVEYRKDTAPELVELLKIDLAAPPQLQDLKHLLSGLAADGERPEGKRRYQTSGDRNTIGTLGLVFSADKSVSVVFGLASPTERVAIGTAQRNAVDVAMHQVSEKLGHLRSRRDGIDHQDPADLTWIQWQHRMSRSGDPHLQTHVTVLNVVRSRVNGKVGTFNTFALHGLYPTIRETYQRTLADELRKLDLPVEFDAKVPAAVLTNIPVPVLQHFSGRKADAERWLQEKLGPNFSALTPHQRSNWLGTASAKTRPPKAMYYVPGNGHTAWHARAAGLGYVPPPQFINPQALQRAGIVHATVQQRQHTPVQSAAQEAPPHARHRQPDTIRPQLDARYNRGGGHYDDKHGLSL